jgi:NAD(P)-dependent dehydrogenase (short-subunit alcohol dehydrogenase family)
MGRLAGKRALITGGSSGIGLATAQLFVAEGAEIIITGRNIAKLNEAQATLPASTQVVASDTGNLAAIADLINLVAENGKLDTLILNAGYVQAGALLDITEEQFDRTMEINVKGAFFTIQEAMRQQLFASKATIVIVTSIINQGGHPSFSLYAASKAALSSLVRTLGLELINAGIRLNAVSPGPVKTEILNKIGIPEEVLETVRRDIAEKSPIKRFAESSEIAQAVLFLASNESSYLVGSEIVVDGGMCLRP